MLVFEESPSVNFAGKDLIDRYCCQKTQQKLDLMSSERHQRSHLRLLFSGQATPQATWIERREEVSQEECEKSGMTVFQQG
jgi:hypothetical protein